MQNLFCYPIVIDELGKAERNYEITANLQELGYIADLLKLPQVKKLKSQIKIKYDKPAHLLYVSGKAEAVLTFESVISLEMFDKECLWEFSDTYNTRPEKQLAKELMLDYNEEIPEAITNGVLDLGNVLIEQVALQIEDHPRQNGEEFSFTPEFDPQEGKKNPFEVLKTLKKDDK